MNLAAINATFAPMELQTSDGDLSLIRTREAGANSQATVFHAWTHREVPQPHSNGGDGESFLVGGACKGAYFPFPLALAFVQDGKKLSRASWAAGAFLVAQKGYPNGIPINRNTAAATGLPDGVICRFAPYLMRRDSRSGPFEPWTPSQADLFAEDWYVVTE